MTSSDSTSRRVRPNRRPETIFALGGMLFLLSLGAMGDDGTTEIATEESRTGSNTTAEDSSSDAHQQKAKIDFTVSAYRQIKAKWSPPLRSDGVPCTLKVTLTDAGTVESIEITKSSGSVEFDNTAAAAVREAAPFSMPTDAKAFRAVRRFSLQFDPRD